MTIKLITGPAAEPISLAEAKSHLRVVGTEDDALISLLISSARQSAEHETGRALVSQTWELVLDAFPTSEIVIPAAGVLSVASVKYLGTDGIEQTLSGAAYVLDAEDAPAYLLPAAGYSWPDTADAANAVRVRFLAGFGAASSDVPASIRHWMLLHIGTAYAQREGVAAGVPVADLPGRYHAALLDAWRVYL